MLPLGIEGIDAYEFILLPGALCILFQEIRDILVVIDVASHGGLAAEEYLGRVGLEWT